jgi:hypothetical protein
VITATVASSKNPNFKSQNVFVVRVNDPLLLKKLFLIAMGSLEIIKMPLKLRLLGVTKRYIYTGEV